MQGNRISLENTEISANCAKYPHDQPDTHDRDLSAAESLSQLTSMLSSKSQDNPSSPNNGTVVTNSPNSDHALAPQKVRTERYVKVSIKGLVVAKQKSLFLSWFLDNNGLPDCCLLLIPERHPNVIISFKGTHGWIELDTNHCKPPDFEVQFELKLHHAFLNRRRYVQNQPIVLRFFLLDKREDGTINNLGEVLLSVLLMSSKCANRTLIAHLIKDDKQRDISLSNSGPSVEQHRKYDEQNEIAEGTVQMHSAMAIPHQAIAHQAIPMHHPMSHVHPMSSMNPNILAMNNATMNSMNSMGAMYGNMNAMNPNALNGSMNPSLSATLNSQMHLNQLSQQLGHSQMLSAPPLYAQTLYSSQPLAHSNN